MPSHSKIFQNRDDAGKQLAKRLFYFSEENPYIIALPRGGVPIGSIVSRVLHAPLEIFVVRKIGSPLIPEFGLGAAAEGNLIFLDREILSELGISQHDLEETMQKEAKEVRRRVLLYRGKRKLPSLTGRTVIIVDDGLATGVTAHAAIAGIKKHNPKKIIFASPVCAVDSAQYLSKFADEVVCLATPPEFGSVASWYWEFNQVSDEEVIRLLKDAKRPKRVNRKSQLLV